VRFILTIEVDSIAAADNVVANAIAKGASLIKAPEQTHYGWYMTVLADPEMNAFRVGSPL
jgi:uncharacterized glyoxalase superfamily protein PhnB